MDEKIENAFGTLYLSEERAKEYMQIVSNYMLNLGIELKQKKFCPVCLSIGKTCVYELDYIKQLNADTLLPDKE